MNKTFGPGFQFVSTATYYPKRDYSAKEQIEWSMRYIKNKYDACNYSEGEKEQHRKWTYGDD
jgi:hypothetical protein